jgi:hypothetical protein
MDELDLNQDTTEINRTQERIIKLNSEAKEAKEAAAAAQAGQEAAEAAKAAAEKERDFYASFTESAVKFPGATEYKDKIKEKVMAGYSTEDATVAVLNSEGKLTQSTPAPAPQQPAAGGSAVNNLPAGGTTKSLSEMTRDEKRQALIESEKRGDISLS